MINNKQDQLDHLLETEKTIQEASTTIKAQIEDVRTRLVREKLVALLKEWKDFPCELCLSDDTRRTIELRFFFKGCCSPKKGVSQWEELCKLSPYYHYENEISCRMYTDRYGYGDKYFAVQILGTLEELEESSKIMHSLLKEVGITNVTLSNSWEVKIQRSEEEMKKSAKQHNQHVNALYHLLGDNCDFIERWETTTTQFWESRNVWEIPV